MKRSLLIFAALCAASWTSVQAAQPTVDPVSPPGWWVDRYANHISTTAAAPRRHGAGGYRWQSACFSQLWRNPPGNNQHPQLDSVIRIASLQQTDDQRDAGEAARPGVVKLNDPLSKYAPPGARVPDWQGKPITLVNLATHTSALPREQPGGAAHRPVFVWPTRQQRWNWLSTATLKTRVPGSQAAYSNLAFDLLAGRARHRCRQTVSAAV